MLSRACKLAEDEVESEFSIIEKIVKVLIMGFQIAFGIVFAVASCYAFFSQSYITALPFILISIVTTIQGVIPFFNKDSWLICIMKKWIQKRKLKEMDKRKMQYSSILKQRDEA